MRIFVKPPNGIPARATIQEAVAVLDRCAIPASGGPTAFDTGDRTGGALGIVLLKNDSDLAMAIVELKRARLIAFPE